MPDLDAKNFERMADDLVEAAGILSAAGNPTNRGALVRGSSRELWVIALLSLFAIIFAVTFAVLAIRESTIRREADMRELNQLRERVAKLESDSKADKELADTKLFNLDARLRAVEKK